MENAPRSSTIRAKLLLLVVLMNVLLLSAGGFLMARLFGVASGYERFRDHTVEFSNLQAVADDVTRLHSGLSTALRNTPPPAFALERSQDDLKSLRVRLGLAQKNHPDTAQELLRDLDQTLTQAELTLNRALSGDATASRDLAQLADTELPRLQRSMSTIVQAQITHVDRSQAATTQSDLRALQYGLMGIGLALLAGLAISYAIFDTVIRPLGQTHRALMQVLSGNFRGLSLPKTDDEIGAIGRVIEDIKARSEHVYRLAYNDSLTDLPNRLQLSRDLSDIAHRTGESQSYGLILFALDRFAALNSSFGPRFGDEVIREARNRLEQLMDDGDRLYRYTGHMFACLLRPHASDDVIQQRANELAEKITADFQQPLRAGDLNLPLSLSIGIALSLHNERPDNIVAEAEAALVEAKRRGGTNTVVGTRDFSENTRKRLAVAGAIRRGLDQSEFEPFYQPILDVQNGRMVGAETLVRWRQSDGRIVMPGDFIFVAEESDLIRGITAMMVEKACLQLAQWKRAGLPTRLAINVSARLVNIGLQDILQDALRNSGVEPSDLEMEITETVVISNQSDAEKLLLDLKRAGYRIVLDDFGTGYSSMGYLSRFDVDKIKIDYQFIKGIVESERQRLVVANMIELGRRLNIEVVAEGVETHEQLRILQTMGNPYVQGWLFSPAVPASDLQPWLEQPQNLLHHKLKLQA